MGAGCDRVCSSLEPSLAFVAFFRHQFEPNLHEERTRSHSHHAALNSVRFALRLRTRHPGVRGSGRHLHFDQARQWSAPLPPFKQSSECAIEHAYSGVRCTWRADEVEIAKINSESRGWVAGHNEFFAGTRAVRTAGSAASVAGLARAHK